MTGTEGMVGTLADSFDFHSSLFSGGWEKQSLSRSKTQPDVCLRSSINMYNRIQNLWTVSTVFTVGTCMYLDPKAVGVPGSSAESPSCLHHGVSNNIDYQAQIQTSKQILPIFWFYTKFELRHSVSENGENPHLTFSVTIHGNTHVQGKAWAHF